MCVRVRKLVLFDKLFDRTQALLGSQPELIMLFPGCFSEKFAREVIRNLASKSACMCSYLSVI